MNRARVSIAQSPRSRWFVVVSFAMAMAWVESAVVFYLRTLVGRIDPYQPKPLPEYAGLALAHVTEIQVPALIPQLRQAAAAIA